MNRLLATVLFACSVVAQADQANSEHTLSEENKAHLIQIAGEALQGKQITQQQYERTIHWINTTPCSGINRHLADDRKAQLEAAIAKEQGFKTVRIFDSFESGGWFIQFTDASVGDEPYLFYSEDPISGSHPVTKWSGAATIFETSEIELWVKENAHGIPARLASCFAWHVTLSPE